MSSSKLSLPLEKSLFMDKRATKIARKKFQKKFGEKPVVIFNFGNFRYKHFRWDWDHSPGANSSEKEKLKKFENLYVAVSQVICLSQTRSALIHVRDNRAMDQVEFIETIDWLDGRTVSLQPLPLDSHRFVPPEISGKPIHKVVPKYHLAPRKAEAVKLEIGNLHAGLFPVDMSPSRCIFEFAQILDDQLRDLHNIELKMNDNTLSSIDIKDIPSISQIAPEDFSFIKETSALTKQGIYIFNIDRSIKVSDSVVYGGSVST